MLQAFESLNLVPEARTTSYSPHTLESQIGRTPLLRLRHIARRHGLSPDVELYAKAEWFNPGGSVKDRAALSIIRAAERDGQLRPGTTLLDATSGNTGIAYAMLGAARGYKVRLVLPGNASAERLTILRAYGADLVLTDPLEGTDGAIVEARRLAAAEPDLFYADQYNNGANWLAHYETTALEIWEQTSRRLTHFVAGLGTSGTFVGVTRRLRELSPTIASYSVQPDGPLHGVEGWKHMPTALKPGIYDETLADGNLNVATEAAYALARELAQTEGLFVGVSSAAALVASIKIGQELSSGVIATMFPDGGLKYLADPFWQQNGAREQRPRAKGDRC